MPNRWENPFKKMVLGVVAGLGIEAGITSEAKAQELPRRESQEEHVQNPDFPLEKFLERGGKKSVERLFGLFDEWKMHHKAGVVAERAAREYPMTVMRYRQELLHGGVSWGRYVFTEAMITGVKAGYPLELGSEEFADPIARKIIEEKMSDLYPVILLGNDVPQDLITSASRAQALYAPIKTLTAFEYGRLASIFPEEEKQRDILTIAVRSILALQKPSDLKTLHFAAKIKSIKKIIVKEYGWEKFLDLCREKKPEILTMYIHPKILGKEASFSEKQMEIFRSTAAQSPGEWIENYTSIEEWDLAKDLKEDQKKELWQLTDRAAFKVITEGLSFIRLEFLGNHREFPGILRGMHALVEQDPVQVLRLCGLARYHSSQATHQVIEEIETRAADAMIRKHIWTESDGRGLTSAWVRYNPSLSKAWYETAAPDAPQGFTSHIVARRGNEEWRTKALKQGLMFESYKHRSTVYDVFSSVYGPPEQDVDVMLFAQAKDDFEEAEKIARELLKPKTSKQAYRYLYLLWKAQPYAFAAWIKDEKNTKVVEDWKKKITPEEWAAFVGESTRIASDVSFKELAKSVIPPGTKFDEKVLGMVAGMNAFHLERVAASAGRDDAEDSRHARIFISIPMIAFEEVITSQAFQTYIDTHAQEKLTYVNAFSLAQAAFRRVVDLRIPLNEESIERALHDIDAQWKKVRTREVFGKKTELIVLAHSERMFKEKEIVEKMFLGHGGSKDRVAFVGKGSGQKKAFLDAIQKPRKGSVTIVFSGHGTKAGLWFSKNESMNAEEVGKALIQSKNIGKTQIILTACYGYDFADNLLGYLREQGVDTTGLVIIAEANEGALGFVSAGGEGEKGVESYYLKAVDEISPGRAVTLEDFRRAESAVWDLEDPAIIIGLPIEAGWIKGIDVAENVQEKDGEDREL